MNILHALRQRKQPLSAGYGEQRKKRSRPIRTNAEHAPVNGNGIPPQKSPATPCTGHQRLPAAPARSGSGCRFHRISAVVAKCEGCYSKEAQEVRYERLDPFRLAPRFRDVLGSCAIHAAVHLDVFTPLSDGR